MKTFLFYLVLFFCSTLCAQKKNIEKLNDDALKIYRTEAKRALSLLEEAQKLSEEKIDVQRTNNSLGIVYRFLGEFEKAKQYSLKVLGTRDIKLEASAYNNIGACNRSMGKYEEAVKFYINALKGYDKLKLDNEYATVCSNLSVVYNSLELYEKAKEYNQTAIEKFTKTENKKGLSEAYNNYAMIVVNEGNLDEALEYFTKSLEIERNLKDKKGISESLNNVGGVYYYQGKINDALKIFREVLAIEKSIKNLGGVASTYNNIAQMLIENKEYTTAKNYIDSAYSFSKKNKISEDYLISIENYINYNEQQQKFKEANQYYKKYNSISDSIRQENNLEQLHDVETKYQTEKKERQILVQRAQIAENQLKIERKNLLILAIISLAVLGGMIGYQFYRVQKIRNKQLEKENQLKDALIKIETQNKLHEQRLRISRDLHDNIGSQLTFIISSIDNLKFILNQENPEISDRLEDISYFTRHTITELRDTIWAMNKENISFADLKIRINNFIENAKLATKGIDFNFEIDEKIDEEFSFSALEGINIYRVIQESINNSIKHAEPTEIQIKFKKNGERFVICVLDNGIGLDENNVKLGNGLHNMYKRIAELGGELTINNNKGKGTKLKINI
ncbi:tetratricopeptide repeat protein [Moheibacter sediminis]|uniref:histidine kinase n=1 Tax=Moheibacter sediminis TaxID=1434700 RepID=A0A1W2BAP5_9FLAO|nr:tetratricopeptide repeat protein [Moheibacter sediminis]SMC70067.1 Tetratricopeptide repeat-containing protein [Moheibacter sediminis]